MINLQFKINLIDTRYRKRALIRHNFTIISKQQTTNLELLIVLLHVKLQMSAVKNVEKGIISKKKNYFNIGVIIVNLTIAS